MQNASKAFRKELFAFMNSKTFSKLKYLFPFILKFNFSDRALDRYMVHKKKRKMVLDENLKVYF